MPVRRDEQMPEEITESPGRMSSLRVVYCRTRSFGLPTSVWTWPVGDALRLRGGLLLCGSATTREETEIVWSVISVTWAASPVTLVTLPTSPPLSWSAAITGMSARMPALEPLSMTIVAYQSVGDDPMTRALIGFIAATPLLPSSCSRL